MSLVRTVIEITKKHFSSVSRKLEDGREEEEVNRLRRGLYSLALDYGDVE